MYTEDLPTVTPEVYGQARWLVEELGGHALALDQAAAYIEESGISLVEYIGLYEHKRKALLNTYGVSGERNRAHPETVASTILLSLQQVQYVNKQASNILYFCSFVLPENIPEKLLQKATWLCPDDMTLYAAIGALRRYSLIERNADSQTYSIHRLVHTIVGESLPPEMKAHWIRRVTYALCLLCKDQPESESNLQLWLIDNERNTHRPRYIDQATRNCLREQTQDNEDFHRDKEFYYIWAWESSSRFVNNPLI